MIIDLKQRPQANASKETGTLSPSVPVPAASSSVVERKLMVELPTPRQIYTIGSAVTGIIRLGSKDLTSIEEIRVSLVCMVRSFYQLHRGSDDTRREVTKLIHRDQTLWCRTPGASDDITPPADIPFSIVIPEVGNDTRGNNPNAPLPPSFEAGKQTGWSRFKYENRIGLVKYYIKASVVRKGLFKRKERCFQPFIFLPPSPAPPLLPPLPESISYSSLDTLRNLSRVYTSSTNICHEIFISTPPSQAITTLWLPDVPFFPRLTKIPFFLSLAIRTNPRTTNSMKTPPKDIPEPNLDKASLHLQRTVRACAKKKVKHNTRTFDKAATDNLLHGLPVQESEWVLMDNPGGGGEEEIYWERGYLWHGLWIFREPPNFVNRQLELKYSLMAEIPIKGIGNDTKLVSGQLDINSGIIAGTNGIIPGNFSTEEMMGEDFPPDYFNEDGDGDVDDDDDDDDHGVDIKA